MLERQELYCHHCDRYVQFSIDVELNGNHVLTCPNCKHEHCRVVRDGKVTDIRWDSRNTRTYTITGYITSTTNSTYITCSTDTLTEKGVFTYQAWMNTTN